MKSNFPLILGLAWIWILIVATGGCGWREVERGTNINFNWDSHTLEVKTEEMSSLLREDRQLEIVFRTATAKLRTSVLKIRNFYLTPNSADAQVFNCHIMFDEEIKHASSTPLPAGELQWIFKKPKFLDNIRLELASTDYLRELDSITEKDTTETLQFGSEDNISLLYRVNSTDGDENCVKPGNKTLYMLQ